MSRLIPFAIPAVFLAMLLSVLWDDHQKAEAADAAFAAHRARMMEHPEYIPEQLDSIPVGELLGETEMSVTLTIATGDAIDLTGRDTLVIRAGTRGFMFVRDDPFEDMGIRMGYWRRTSDVVATALPPINLALYESGVAK